MKRFSRVLPFAAALIFATATSASFADQSEMAKAVWDRHVRAAISGDVDAVMQDFTEDSVIITMDGTIAGKDAIRGFFEEFLGAAAANPVVNREIVHGNIVVFNFTEGDQTFHDTAVIADDKIVAISTIGYPAR